MIIIISIVLLITGAIFMFKPKRKIDSKLISTSTVSSGSMNGGRSETSINVIVNPKLSHIINLKMSHLSMC